MNRFFWVVAFCAGTTAALLSASCSDKKCPPNAPCPTPTPGPTTCSNVAGSRSAFWSDSCGRSGSGIIVIAQAGCSFGATFTGLGIFTGTVSGSKLSYNLQFTDPCSGTATGTASVSGSVINGTYSGTQAGGGSCCSPVTGSISVQFAPTPPPVTGTPNTATPTPLTTTTATPTTTPIM